MYFIDKFFWKTLWFSRAHNSIPSDLISPTNLNCPFMFMMFIQHEYPIQTWIINWNACCPDLFRNAVCRRFRWTTFCEWIFMFVTLSGSFHNVIAWVKCMKTCTHGNRYHCVMFELHSIIFTVTMQVASFYVCGWHRPNVMLWRVTLC